MAASHYSPDNAQLDLPTLTFLRGTEGTRLRAEVARLPDPSAPAVAEVARLRKAFPAEAVRAALILGAIQAKARSKFPELPYVWSPPEALEQATGTRVARHKASRFAAAIEKAPGPVYDLCCGIGGDAMALADVAPVTAVDLSETRLACLRKNLAERSTRFPINLQQADIADIPLPAAALVHIDPARRSSGKRSPRYEDLIPDPTSMTAWVAGAAIKLSPAVDFDMLPPGHLELISDHGTVVQAVLWTGRLAFAGEAERTAAVLTRGDGSWCYTAHPAQAEVGNVLPGDVELQTCLYELDGTLTRSGLAAPFSREHGLMPLTSDGGYALSLRPDLAAALPCVTPFALLAMHSYTERRLTAALRELPEDGTNGVIEVKCRGHLPDVDTDRLQRLWSRECRGRYTVLIFRHKDHVLAAIARRT